MFLAKRIIKVNLAPRCRKAVPLWRACKVLTIGNCE